MKTLDFIQASISYNPRDPHSKALEPDCLSLSAFNYDTVSQGGGETGEFYCFFFSSIAFSKILIPSWEALID